MPLTAGHIRWAAHRWPLFVLLDEQLLLRNTHTHTQRSNCFACSPNLEFHCSPNWLRHTNSRTSVNEFTQTQTPASQPVSQSNSQSNSWPKAAIESLAAAKLRVNCCHMKRDMRLIHTHTHTLREEEAQEEERNTHNVVTYCWKVPLAAKVLVILSFVG